MSSVLVVNSLMLALMERIMRCEGAFEDFNVCNKLVRMYNPMAMINPVPVLNNAMLAVIRSMLAVMKRMMIGYGLTVVS